MTEETESLDLAMLKRMQAEFALMCEEFGGIRGEIIVMRQRVAAFVTHGANRDAELHRSS